MTLRHALILCVLLLPACAGTPAQNSAAKGPASTTETADFTVTSEPGSWRKQSAVQGYVYNKRGMRATQVRLRIEALDATSKVVWSEVRQLDRDIPSNDRAFYQMVVSSPAPMYRVQVEYVWWRPEGGGPGVELGRRNAVSVRGSARSPG